MSETYKELQCLGGQYAIALLKAVDKLGLPEGNVN